MRSLEWTLWSTIWFWWEGMFTLLPWVGLLGYLLTRMVIDETQTDRPFRRVTRIHPLPYAQVPATDEEPWPAENTVHQFRRQCEAAPCAGIGRSSIARLLAVRPSARRAPERIWELLFTDQFTTADALVRHPDLDRHLVAVWVRSANAATEQCYADGQELNFCLARGIQCANVATRKAKRKRVEEILTHYAGDLCRG